MGRNSGTRSPMANIFKQFLIRAGWQQNPRSEDIVNRTVTTVAGGVQDLRVVFQAQSVRFEKSYMVSGTTTYSPKPEKHWMRIGGCPYSRVKALPESSAFQVGTWTFTHNGDIK